MSKEEEKLISEVKRSHFMAVAYHWVELPQVSFLSQQKLFFFGGGGGGYFILF